MDSVIGPPINLAAVVRPALLMASLFAVACEPGYRRTGSSPGPGVARSVTGSRLDPTTDQSRPGSLTPLMHPPRIFQHPDLEAHSRELHGALNPLQLRPVVADASPWHTYPPGAPFTVDVHVEGNDLGVDVTCWWIDAERNPISAGIAVGEVPQAIQSPSAEPGFYGLVFASSDPHAAFAPQPAGLPSSVYGFAIIPDPPAGPVEVAEESSPFGMIQGNKEDPYFRSGSGPKVTGIHLKTKTWHESPRWWTDSIADRTSAGHTEMPLINNDPWDSDGSQPITLAQLDEVGSQFRDVLAAEPSAVDCWQTGLEENGPTGVYEEPYYFANLLAKMQRLRAEADQINPDVKFVYSTRGRDMEEFEQLFSSAAFVDHCVGLAQDPYYWPDFPSPEDWLQDHIADIRTRMDAAGLTGHFLWFGELGIPVRGINDPDGFFGYPDSGDEVPGASLDYAASYLIKCHALAIAAGVERVYVYNYKNRDNDVFYAEDHFGLRTYAEPSSNPGHPLPGYVAYINMLAHLKGSTFVAQTQPVPGVFAFEFAVNGTAERRLLAWVHPEGEMTLPLASLVAGLTEEAVQSATDLYGTPVPVLGGGQITLNGRPVYLRF